MGVIGTVMGLVNVLGHLDEPATLGESIAVAFIATLIGVASANIVWLPISNSLKVNSAIEVAERRMAMTGILAIQAGDNPRIVAQKLDAFGTQASAKGSKADAGSASGADAPRAVEEAA